MFQVFSMLRPGTKMTVDGLRARFAAVDEIRASAESLKERHQQALQALRDAAQASGLAGEMAKLEHPTVEEPPQREEATRRVRVLESSFATEHLRLLYSGVRGEVVDLPASLAKKLVRAAQVEEVPADMPLHRREIQWR
jgi:hypothetical protein